MADVFRVFENLLDVIFVLDGEFNLHFGNDSAAQLLDVSARRLASGRPLANFLTFSPALFEDGNELAQIDAPTQMREIQFATNGGKDGWAQVSIQSLPEEIRIASGATEGRWLLYFRDVTLEKTLHDKYKTELDQKEAVIEDLRAARNELENYSKNLEKMVEVRTAELREANRLLATILDSLGQGIFVFDSGGKVLPVFSKVSERMFGMIPAGRAVTDVLSLSGADRETFMKWLEAVFSEMLSFEDLVPLAPSRLSRGDDRHIALGFHPMRGDGNSLQGVVLVATDKTDEMRAKREAERERSFAKRIVQIVQHRSQFRLFANEAMRICDDLLDKARSGEALDGEETARHLHTIKGGAASFTLLDIADIAHHCEEALGRKMDPEKFLLELTESVNRIQLNLREFLESHKYLVGGPIERAGRVIELPAATLCDWSTRLTEAANAPLLGLEIIENWVFEPVATSFSHIDSGLQDLAGQLGKKLKPLAIEGGELRVLPEAFSDLFPTFIHAFRNAVDHGIETPQERVAAGKGAEGSIAVRFLPLEVAQRPYLKIEIRDDGRGIDPEKIRASLLKKGIPFSTNASDQEIIQAVFRDDFSTAQQVTTISGRGVGLSAIKAEAERMGGTCEIHSRVGSGSVLTVIVPDPSRNAASHPIEIKKVS